MGNLCQIQKLRIHDATYIVNKHNGEQYANQDNNIILIPNTLNTVANKYINANKNGIYFIVNNKILCFTTL